jgi:glutamate-1-semialdehyde 2,1-aminomutase
MTDLATARSSGPLLERADVVFPSGALGTFLLPKEVDFVTVRGAGSHVWDADEAEYIDYVLGSGPMIVGHAHPLVTEAIARQAALGTTFYNVNPAAIELAERVLDVFPTDRRVLFTSSGSEATFYAMRLARAFTGRSRVVKFRGAYHGHQDYAMPDAFAGAANSDPKSASAGVPEATLASTSVADFNDLESVERILLTHPDEVAAVIVEPYQRVVEPAAGFLPGLADLCRAHGALLIADEVVTGFRFHYGMAQQLYGFTADLTALGKIIGGGLPVAAVVGRADIMALADARRRTAHNYVYASGTLNGYALGAAAGLATLDVLSEPGAYERLNEIGDRIRGWLKEDAESSGHRATVVGRGPMFHVLFGAADVLRSSLDVAAADHAKGVRFGTELLRRRVMVNPQQRSYVSLAHTDRDLEETRTRIASALSALG